MISPKKDQLDSLLMQYKSLGAAMYGGEAVTQMEHALQCAQLSRQNLDHPSLITASFFHDVGHLLAHLVKPTLRDSSHVDHDGVDDQHERLALIHLESLFGPAVTQPIFLHVNAKRYLCAAQEKYWQSLSQASKDSLELQGGIFSAEESQDFLNLPFATDAVKLRQYDDLAKVPHRMVPTLDSFIPIFESVLIS